VQPRLLEEAVACELRSLFVGFETINATNLRTERKFQNQNRDYGAAIQCLHGLGVMINGSFVFGMDDDDRDVFERTVEWAVEHGIETATFHILTPYPGTATFHRMEANGRLLTRDWDLYDTRHSVFKPAKMTPLQLEEGYWSAYHNFYRWSNILKGANTKTTLVGAARHVAYSAGWKKFEPLWNVVIRARQVAQMRPVLESILGKVGRLNTGCAEQMAAASPTTIQGTGADVLIQID
jgi:hypothetical protein